MPDSMKDRSIFTVAVVLVVTLAASMSGAWLEQEGRIVRGDIFTTGHAIVKDGAPRIGGRFTNRAEPGERVPLGAWAGFLGDRPQRAGLADVHPAACRVSIRAQDRDPLARERMEWMRDDQRVKPVTVRGCSMPRPSECPTAAVFHLPLECTDA